MALLAVLLLLEEALLVGLVKMGAGGSKSSSIGFSVADDVLLGCRFGLGTEGAGAQSEWTAIGGVGEETLGFFRGFWLCEAFSVGAGAGCGGVGITVGRLLLSGGDVGEGFAPEAPAT